MSASAEFRWIVDRESTLATRLRPRAWIVLSACLVLGAVGVALSGCSGEPDRIDVAYAPFEPTALIWIAEARQFFQDEGLAVTFHRYDTGPAALEAMLAGEADMAVGVGEFPMVGKVLQQTQARIIASMDRSELISVVARRDSGITEVADLKGKRVGTTRGTIAEFFLGRFLEINGLSTADLTLVELKTPGEWVEAVAKGDVDAVATAEPFAAHASERLGTNAVSWSAHSGQPMYALAIASDEWLTAHPEVARRFLEALAQAETYALRSPAEAQTIVQTALDLEPASMQAVWERNQFSLSLDQSLIAAMEDEARWLIGNDLAAEASVPDFLGFIWEDGLGEVWPRAVNIIRPSSP